MKLECGCEVRQLPDETVITACGSTHRVWWILELAEAVDSLERVPK